MSHMSVVHYSPPINNVLQQNNISNKQNERQIIVLRKPQHILPQSDKEEVLLTNNNRKKPKPGKEPKANAQSVSVARRNARERNRVKQVNNGFANLRQHIPNFIAAAFESNSGRGGNKKLSKVETLRMAVEYIRSLEEILNMDADSTEIMDHLADLPYPSPSSSTSPTHPSSTINYCYQAVSPQTTDEDLSNSARSTQQFIKLTDSHSFQIVPANTLENGENLDPMVVDDNLLEDPSLLDPNLQFAVTNEDFSYLNSMHSTASLSPGFYSDSSLSSIQDIKSETNSFVTVFNTPPEDRHSSRVEIKLENNCDMPVISLKTEHELPDVHKESIATVLEWWDQQPQNTGS